MVLIGVVSGCPNRVGSQGVQSELDESQRELSLSGVTLKLQLQGSLHMIWQAEKQGRDV
jgi:hypothetical protein